MVAVPPAARPPPDPCSHAPLSFGAERTRAARACGARACARMGEVVVAVGPTAAIRVSLTRDPSLTRVRWSPLACWQTLPAIVRASLRRVRDRGNRRSARSMDCASPLSNAFSVPLLHRAFCEVIRAGCDGTRATILVACSAMGEHDLLFKRAFRLPEHAAGELSAVLPKEVLEAIDAGSLALVQGDFVGQKLDERFTDALFSASFRGVPGYVWFLLEHQSEPDRWMVLRVLDYLVRSWLELLRLEPERKTLPPVVCVVVHHGERGWNEPVKLHELVEGLRELAELRGLVPDFEILVDDLVRQPDEELKRRPLAVFPKVVLWVLRDARTVQRFYHHLRAWGEELERLARESPEDMATVARYVWMVAGDEPVEAIQKRIIEVAPATEDVMASAAEQLIQRGKIQGKAEGKAEAILAVLEARGLAVSAAERARITECKDVAELDRFLRAAVTAGSAAELFSH